VLHRSMRDLCGGCAPGYCEQTVVAVDARGFRLQTVAGRIGHRGRSGLSASTGQPGVAWWRAAVAGVAVVAAVAAVWVTLDADFLAYPGWLAAQKADFILGPVFVGLYWLRQRPGSRFGPMLIAFGFVGAVYVLHSSSDRWLFGTGLLWENVIGLATFVLILTFPTGRLDGLAAKLILLGAFVAAFVPGIVIALLLPQVGAGGSISGCRALCPENALAITSEPTLALDLWEIFRYAVIGLALATAALLIWRLMTGTPPQRRALAIGASIALVFLLLQATFHILALVAPDATTLREVIAWAFAGARAAIWYGFLFALIAAQLFAARALQRLVGQSLQRPSQRELEAMLREPLGDPELRLVFKDPRSDAWDDADGGDLVPRLSEPGPGRDLTVVESRGRPAVAILHDAQLNDDPELLRAAGAVALLAAENAELDAGWNEALQELQRSRALIVRAGDNERRKLERNLHDGVQQRLIAIKINLDLARELAAGDAVIRSRLDEIGHSVEEALDELRQVAHGLYPPALADWGLVAALERIHLRANAPLVVHATGIGRHPAELETAIYYCCLEAVQNATKHGGDAVHVSVMLRQDDDELGFDVSDDGPGFDPSAARSGTGLRNMRDRVDALNGRLSIVSSAGQGTIVSGSVPLRDAHPQTNEHDHPEGAGTSEPHWTATPVRRKLRAW
jgi:signal transduction histidine kinase